MSKFAGARPLASAVPAAVRPRQFWPPHHPQGRNRPPHLGFQQCDHPSRCGAEPPNQQEPHTHSKWWRRHDADDDGNGRYAGARRPARIAPRPRRPLSSVGQSCGLLIRRSWVRAPQGVPRKSQCQWLEWDVEPSLKPATAADYRTSVDRHIIPAIGRRRHTDSQRGFLLPTVANHSVPVWRPERCGRIGCSPRVGPTPRIMSS